MNETRKMIIDRLVQGKTTNLPGDTLYQAELLRVYKPFPEEYQYLQSLILSSRREWLNWVTCTQSNWQRKGKNNHHDSFELRESYICPHANPIEEREFEKRARQYNKLRKPELFIWKYGVRE
jgi:hypothetical protein